MKGNNKQTLQQKLKNTLYHSNIIQKIPIGKMFTLNETKFSINIKIDLWLFLQIFTDHWSKFC